MTFLLPQGRLPFTEVGTSRHKVCMYSFSRHILRYMDFVVQAIAVLEAFGNMATLPAARLVGGKVTGRLHVKPLKSGGLIAMTKEQRWWLCSCGR